MNRSDLQLLIDAIEDDSPNTAAEVRNVLSAIADGLSGTVKILEVPTAYIAANFDPTGLGINLELGYAICNGNNGTRDWRGRVPMQYSTTFPTLGATLGSANTVLVSHDHQQGSESLYNLYGGGSAVGGRTYPSGSIQAYRQQNTSTVGESGVNKNYQPSIVTLITVKL